MKNKYKSKIFKQELFIGNDKNNNYFEGWYFKHVDKECENSISFIVGISKSDDSHCFIQIIDNIKNKSYYLKYDIADFKVNNDNFQINIKDNIFSLNRIYVNIKKPKITVDITYDSLTPIDKNIYAPNIMGPFGYLTFMECNHSVISLRHKLNGYVRINNKKTSFDNGTGYIEKDYGTSFPSKYLWLQSNSNKKDSIFLAIAKIPFMKFNFKGHICILEVDGKQYRFSTYNLGSTKLKKINKNEYIVTLKQGNKRLEILLKCLNPIKLIAPKNGNMKDTVLESLSSTCEVKLFKNKQMLFNDKFIACGCELFNY